MKQQQIFKSAQLSAKNINITVDDNFSSSLNIRRLGELNCVSINNNSRQNSICHTKKSSSRSQSSVKVLVLHSRRWLYIVVENKYLIFFHSDNFLVLKIYYDHMFEVITFFTFGYMCW